MRGRQFETHLPERRPVQGISSLGFGPRVPLHSTHGPRSGPASRLFVPPGDGHDKAR